MLALWPLQPALCVTETHIPVPELAHADNGWKIAIGACYAAPQQATLLTLIGHWCQVLRLVALS